MSLSLGLGNAQVFQKCLIWRMSYVLPRASVVFMVLMLIWAWWSKWGEKLIFRIHGLMMLILFDLLEINLHVHIIWGSKKICNCDEYLHAYELCW